MKKMAKKENEKIATSLIKHAQPAHSRAHAYEGTADGLDIREDEHNYRKHSDKNLSLIGKSLDDFGAGRSIVADSTGAVIGGNGTLRAANQRGIPKRIIHTNGDELVVVVRDDIAPDDPRRAKLAIMDNSTTDSSEFDIEALQMDFEPIELENLGVELPEIEEVGIVEGETDPDSVPESAEAPVSIKGGVYQLGDHRLMCGDSTSAQDVARLMGEDKADMVFTDPPYGVSYTEKNEFLNRRGAGHRLTTPIENDAMPPEEMRDFWVSAFENLHKFTKERMSYYITAPQGGDLLLLLLQSIREAGFMLKHQLVWNKNNHVLGRCDYDYKHEPIVYGWKIGGTHNFFGGGKFKTSVWDIPKPTQSKLHPTMKPVELVANATLDATARGDFVLDLFGGSGTTLIACEQTGRKCRMMELDPHYCDVIRKRWAEFKYGEGCDWQSLAPALYKTSKTRN